MIRQPLTTREQQTYEARLWWAVQPQWLWRLVRLTLRCFWIAASAAALGWLTARALGLDAPLPAWLAGGFALFMLLLPLTLLWPMPLQRIARRVDDTFKLGDRVSTAGEIAGRGPQNYMEGRLLTATHQLLGNVRAKLLRAPRVPWVDLELAAIAALALYACYLLAGPLAPTPPIIPNAAYDAPDPLQGEVVVPLPGQGGETTNTGAQGQETEAAAAQQVLDALAEALMENSVTEASGAALAQGDTDRSAELLRELADAADSLSPEIRQALANSLREAADEIGSAAPDAAAQIDATADALTSDAPGAASGGLEDLAQMIEDMETARQPNDANGAGNNTSGNGEGSGQGAGNGDTTGRESQTDGTTERLQGENEPVELPDDAQPTDQDSVLQPPDHESEATDTRDTPYTHTGATGSGGDETADPLSFPWRLRNVVQRYFSPR